MSEMYLKSKNSILICNIKNCCHALIFLLNNDLTKAKCYAKIVWDNLENLDTWYLNDVRIITNILFLFEIETTEDISLKCIEVLNRYQEYTNVETMKISIYLNLVYLKIESHDNFHKIKFYCEKIITLCLEQKRYDLLAIVYIRYGITLHHLDNSEKHLYLKKGMEILKVLELNLIKKELENEMKLFI